MTHLDSPAGAVRLDRHSRRLWVRGPGGSWRLGPPLTPKEYELLCLFLESPGRTFDRRRLLETLWEARCDRVNPETVDKHVASLRRKLGKRGACLKTVRGAGYALEG